MLKNTKELTIDFISRLATFAKAENPNYKFVITGSTVMMVLKHFGLAGESRAIPRKVSDLDIVVLPEYNLPNVDVIKTQNNALRDAYENFATIAKEAGFEILESSAKPQRASYGSAKLFLRKNDALLEVHTVAEFVNYIKPISVPQLDGVSFLDPKVVFATKLGRLMGSINHYPPQAIKYSDLVDLVNMIEDGSAGVTRKGYDIVCDAKTLEEIRLFTIMTIGTIVNQPIDSLDTTELKPTEKNSQDFCDNIKGHINEDKNAGISKALAPKILHLVGSLTAHIFPNLKLSTTEKEFIDLMTCPQIPQNSGIYKDDKVDIMVGRVIDKLKEQYADVFRKYPEIEQNIKVSPAFRLNASSQIDSASLG